LNSSSKARQDSNFAEGSGRLHTLFSFLSPWSPCPPWLRKEEESFFPAGGRAGRFVVARGRYIGVALLVLPWLGFLLDSWLGVPLGIAVYVGSWLFVAEEERTLAKTFGVSWGEYCARVKMP
jgi:hypothetical protein